MNLRKANLAQLLYLARFTEYRMESLIELDRRLYSEEWTRREQESELVTC